MREAEIEKKLVAGIKRLGGRAYKWVSPGNNGVPDRIVVLPNLPAVFVELKTESGKLTGLQKTAIEKLRKMGQDVRVLYGEKPVRTFLEECEEKMKHENRVEM